MQGEISDHPMEQEEGVVDKATVLEDHDIDLGTIRSAAPSDPRRMLPRPLSCFLPDRRDIRDVECRRWRCTRLPDGWDQRARLLRALHYLYQDYQRVCAHLPEGPLAQGIAVKSREFDSLSLTATAPDQVDLGERRIVVIQRSSRRRNQITNQVLLKRAACAEVWIDVPLSLELQLPRVREMLGQVMSACPFVSDPMEVLGELRAAGYRTENCVEYLKEVKELREAVALSVDETFNCSTNRNHLPLPPQPLPPLPPPPSPPPSRPPSPPPVFSTDVHHQLLNCLVNLRASIADCLNAVSVTAGGMEVAVAGVAGHAANLGRSCRRLRRDIRTTRARRLQREVAELRARCRDEERQRRSAFNDLQEQLGSVRVFARCRRGPGEQAVVPCGPENLRVLSDSRGGRSEIFNFDGVFVGGCSGCCWQKPKRQQGAINAGEASNGDIFDDDSLGDIRLFDELRPLIASFLDGYNVCFIAYGGEASGKTHTLHGPGGASQSGLVYRSLIAALAEARDRSAAWNLELRVACLEVYNDSVLDIGDKVHRPQRLPSSCLDSGLPALFDTLCQLEISCDADALVAIQLAASRRRTARTALNPQSSRSHLLQLLQVRGHSQTHGERVCAFLGLMDLAGAENVIKAATIDDPRRTAEAGYINRSLASFNRLFLNLRRCSGGRGVPSYRDSRLTQLMKPFVTDHGKCCIIVTVRTDRQSLSASLNSLRFGRDARQVMLGRARRQLV